jgi:hypothetical protein
VAEERDYNEQDEMEELDEGRTSQQMKGYYYDDGDVSEDYSNLDELNEQILEEDRRRLRQLGLEQ